MKRKLSVFLALLLTAAMLLTGCAEFALDVLDAVLSESETVSETAGFIADSDPTATEAPPDTAAPVQTEVQLPEDAEYSSRDEVALYLHLYGHLPANYITKNEAQALGWISNKGNLWQVAPGKSIGGDHFGNYEGLLPEAKGRVYRECDIDFDGTYRNAKRIIFSNDGLIYYTEDHYESFELLYGEE